MSLARLNSRFALATLAVGLLTANAAPADTVLEVDTEIDDPAAVACLNDTPDDCSLRGAITTANGLPAVEPVTIVLPQGTYLLTTPGAGEDNNQTGDLDVLRSLTFQGFIVGTNVDGGGAGGLADRLLEVHGAGTLLTVNNMTFRGSVPPADLHAVTVGPDAIARFNQVRIESNGSLATGGGGVFVAQGASASINDSRVWFNAGLHGVGIRAQDGSVLITNSEIRNNSATIQGAGVELLDSLVGAPDVLTAESSYFFNNISAEGGGIWAGTDTELLLYDNFFEDNRVTIGPWRRGGGIFSRGEVTLEGTTITGGSANEGAAIFIEDSGDNQSKLDMVNSTISGASLISGVAAIHLFETTSELLFVTMAENVFDLIAIQGEVQVTGSLFEGGCQSIAGAVIQSSGTNLGLDASCWDGLPAPGDLVVADLMLGPLDQADGPTPTHLPELGSPAVDHVLGPCLPSDQRHRMRPASGCDSGAVERDPVDVFMDGFETGDTTAWTTVVP